MPKVKLQNYSLEGLNLEPDARQIPESTRKPLEKCLEQYEWTLHLKTSIDKVLADTLISAYVLLYTGLETEITNDFRYNGKPNAIINMDRVATRINCNRCLLWYIGGKYGNLLDNYWKEIVPSLVIKLARRRAKTQEKNV